MLEQAFNLMLSLHSTKAVLRRHTSNSSLTSDIRITPSNYFRNQEGPGASVVEGREFVISKNSIVTPLTPILKRGDKIETDDYGNLTINEIIEMYDLGGTIMGWRIRTA